MPTTYSPRAKQTRRKQATQPWDADLDAAARLEIVRSYNHLIATGTFPVTTAARWLGISPSVMSGRAGLPAKFQTGGIAALRLKRRPSPCTRVAALTQALKDGQVIVYEGRVIGGLR